MFSEGIMTSKLTKMVCLSLVIFIGLTGCDTFQGTESPITNTPEPLATQIPTEMPVSTSIPVNTGEARIRYIMADIALMQSMDYYKGFPEDPEAVEAMNRIFSGYGIENLSDFERKDVPGIGWQVVYAGTKTTINGMDVKLVDRSMDICNPDHISLTPEEQANCGDHQYSQTLLSLAITTPPHGTCGFYIMDGDIHYVDGGDSPGAGYPPTGMNTFYFAQDGLCFLSSSGVESEWFFEGNDCDNNKKGLWRQTGINTYSYQKTFSAGRSQEYKLIFSSSGFAVEKYNYSPEFNGLCASMSATLISEP